MDINLLDKSNYLKGLFIAVKLDGQLNIRQREILKIISDRLGFSRDFYEETIRNLLRNNYIKEEILLFSSKEIAVSFINDAFNISSFKNNLKEKRIDWFKKIARSNNVEVDFFNDRLDT